MITTTTCSGSRWRICAQHLLPLMPGSIRSSTHQVDLLALEGVEPLLAAAGGDVVCPSRWISAVRTSCRTSSSSMIRMFMPAASARWAERQLDGEAAPPARLAHHAHLAAVAAHDLVADRQPEAGAAPRRLGGEEGLEDLLQLLGCDPRAVVWSTSTMRARPDRATVQAAGSARARAGDIASSALTSRLVNTCCSSPSIRSTASPRSSGQSQSTSIRRRCQASREQVDAVVGAAAPAAPACARLLAVAGELEQVVDDAGGAEGLPLHLLEDRVARIVLRRSRRAASGRSWRCR